MITAASMVYGLAFPNETNQKMKSGQRRHVRDFTAWNPTVPSDGLGGTNKGGQIRGSRNDRAIRYSDQRRGPAHELTQTSAETRTDITSEKKVADFADTA